MTRFAVTNMLYSEARYERFRLMCHECFGEVQNSCIWNYYFENLFHYLAQVDDCSQMYCFLFLISWLGLEIIISESGQVYDILVK